MYLFSPSTNGFYVTEIHGQNIPGDVVEVSEERHTELFNGQSAGKRIAAGPDGYPVLIDPPAPSAAEQAEVVDAQRAAAYRDEADPLFFKVQRGEAERADWLAKIEEIKARFPKVSA